MKGDLLLAVGFAPGDGAAAPRGSIHIRARGGGQEVHSTVHLASPRVRDAWTEIRYPGLAAPGREVRLTIDFDPPVRRPGKAWIETPLRWIPADSARLPPNVLLVTVDTLRADAARLAVEGTLPATALPWLARRGAYDPRAVAAGSNTSASHASILLSLDPQDHGAFDNRGLARVRQPTLADRLRARGYATAAAVTVGLLSPRRFPPTRGFETVFHPSSGVTRPAADLLEDLLPWLRERARAPFFLWLHLFEPHQPYGPEARARLGDVPEFRERLPSIREAVRRHGPPERFEDASVDAAAEHLWRKMRLYHAEILEVDARLAEVFGTLEEGGALDRTFVILTGDHGESLWEGGLYGFHKGPSEVVARVPFLAAGPGIRPGRRPRTSFRHVDLAPTILGLLGMGPGPGAVVRGADRSRELRGESASPPEEAFYQFREKAVACYREDWKAVYEGDRDEDAGGRFRLYRLDGDPAASRDLTAAHPAVARAMRESIHRWLSRRLAPGAGEAAGEAGGEAGGEASGIDPEREEMLRQLGYE